MFADLSAAVDVYADWTDACEAVAKEEQMARDDELGISSGIGASQSQQVAEPDELGGAIDDDDY
jgi:transcription elongation factor Elf1